MRFTALIPVFLLLAALILSFLCLFAGSKQDFLQDYALVTLNTSRIGQNIFNTTSESSSNPISSFIDDITNTIESKIQDGLTSLAQDLGLHDWYSAHVLTYCEGYYTPAAVPNATISLSSIDQNVTDCTNRTALLHFDPRTVLQRELNNSGLDIDLSDLNWPDAIDDGVRAVATAARAMFVIWCIAIGLIAIAFLSAIVSIFFEGRISALVNLVADWLAFIFVGIASALATAVAIKIPDVINKYGGRIGVGASTGGRFLALAWVATGCVLLASLTWCTLSIVGRRNKHTSGSKGRKYG